MPFHFRKRIRIAPGLHLNVTEKGIRSASAKVGPATVNSKGTVSAGLGEGITYRGKWRQAGQPIAEQQVSGHDHLDTNLRILFWFAWPMAFLLLFIWWPAGVTLVSTLVLVSIRKVRRRSSR